MRSRISVNQLVTMTRSDRPTVRTITRFKLRDLYKETGQPDLALEELDTIIDENR